MFQRWLTGIVMEECKIILWELKLFVGQSGVRITILFLRKKKLYFYAGYIQGNKLAAILGVVAA